MHTNQVAPQFQSSSLSRSCSMTGFVQVMKNLENHGIIFYDFIFKARKVMESRCGLWKVMENDFDCTK